jgi:putative lipoprotein (rSAM/lipoprotein system)
MVPFLRLRLLKFLMRLLGIGSVGLFMACTKYGAPVDVAPMNIEGSVVSKDSAKAIVGIEIEVVNGFGNATSQTNSNGIFHFGVDVDLSNKQLRLIARDVDGNSNGSFQNLDTTLHISSAEIEMGDKKNIHLQLKRQ